MQSRINDQYVLLQFWNTILRFFQPLTRKHGVFYLQVTVKVNRVPLRLQWAQESLEYLVKTYVLRFCISHRLPCDGIGSLGGIGILSSKS